MYRQLLMVSTVSAMLVTGSAAMAQQSDNQDRQPWRDSQSSQRIDNQDRYDSDQHRQQWRNRDYEDRQAQNQRYQPDHDSSDRERSRYGASDRPWQNDRDNRNAPWKNHRGSDSQERWGHQGDRQQNDSSQFFQYIYLQGYMEGKEEGIQQGLLRGFQQGYSQGLQQGYSDQKGPRRQGYPGADERSQRKNPSSQGSLGSESDNTSSLGARSTTNSGDDNKQDQDE